jgi:hypothetical protein
VKAAMRCQLKNPRWRGWCAFGRNMLHSASWEGTLAYLIGAVLALAAGGLGTVTALDRDRAFYPTIMLVIAMYYVLFAVMGGSTHALLIELAIATIFMAVTLVGFKYSLWLVVAALASHCILDSVHVELIANPGLPAWWPPFCLAYDGVAAAYLAFLLRRDPNVAAT